MIIPSTWEDHVNAPGDVHGRSRRRRSTAPGAHRTGVVGRCGPARRRALPLRRAHGGLPRPARPRDDPDLRRQRPPRRGRRGLGRRPHARAVRPRPRRRGGPRRRPSALYAEQAGALRDALVGADTVLAVWREPLEELAGAPVRVDRRIALDVRLPAHRLLPCALVAPERRMVVTAVCGARPLAAGRPPMGIVCAQQDVARVYPLPDDPERCLADFLEAAAEHARGMGEQLRRQRDVRRALPRALGRGPPAGRLTARRGGGRRERRAAARGPRGGLAGRPRGIGTMRGVRRPRRRHRARLRDPRLRGLLAAAGARPERVRRRARQVLEVLRAQARGDAGAVLGAAARLPRRAGLRRGRPARGWPGCAAPGGWRSSVRAVGRARVRRGRSGPGASRGARGPGCRSCSACASLREGPLTGAGVELLALTDPIGPKRPAPDTATCRRALCCDAADAPRPSGLLTPCTLALVAAALAATAQAADTPQRGALYDAGPSGRYLLDGEWLFRLDAADQGLQERYMRQRRRAAGRRSASRTRGTRATTRTSR